MKSESNKHAIIILLLLVATAIILFLTEKKFLIREARGSTLSHYEMFKGVDQIILLIEDFEGLKSADTLSIKDSVLKFNGLFCYGSAKISMDYSMIDNDPTASKSSLMVEWNGTDQFGGWGKGVGANIELDPLTDYVNFRIYIPESNGKEEKIKILLAEDDNEDAILQEDQDDSWFCVVNISTKNRWQLISVPLKNFTDEGVAGDGILNVTRRGGLHTIAFVFDQPDKYVQGQKWYFDFINVSSERLADGISLE